MKKVKRVARKVGLDEDDQDSPSTSTTEQTSTSAVKRPTLSSRASSKPQKSSHLRTSLPSSNTPDDLQPPSTHDSNSNTLTLPAHTTSRKTTLSKHVLIRNAALLPSRPRSLSPDSQPDQPRPSYSADYLAELKSSTPSTPRDLTLSADRAASSSRALDIALKFGDDAFASVNDAQAYIPSQAEIDEKKSRRRRLAKEQDFVSLDSGNNGGDDNGASSASDGETDDGGYGKRSLVIPAEEVDLKAKYAPSRLEEDEADIGEGFDDFVEDAGRVTLGRKGMKVQEWQRRKEMAEQIKAAQFGYGYGAGVSGDESEGDDDAGGEGGEDVDDDEMARNAAYEAKQTRAAMYGAAGTAHSQQREEKAREERFRRRLEYQPRIRPIPELKNVVGRFWEMVEVKERALGESRKRLEALEREMVEIEGEEERVKVLLEEAGRRFEKLQMESGGPGGPGGEGKEKRGLDTVASMASSAVATPAAERDSDADAMEESEDDAHHDSQHNEDGEEAEPPAQASMEDMFPGMGMRGGLGMGGFSGMGGGRDEEEDY